ncbi:MAG: DUF4006 family protein [Helicobacteraceae bacterium]|jgi:uncharacterized membrane protein|nr:DUF4006 family protein [Helicobacteraceae bacterium]
MSSSDKSGSYFALNGISGMLVAVVLLLSIIGTLTFLGIKTQQASATNPYVVKGAAVANPKTKEDVYKNLQEVQMYDAGARFNAFKPVEK